MISNRSGYAGNRGGILEVCVATFSIGRAEKPNVSTDLLRSGKISVSLDQVRAPWGARAAGPFAK